MEAVVIIWRLVSCDEEVGGSLDEVNHCCRGSWRLVFHEGSLFAWFVGSDAKCLPWGGVVHENSCVSRMVEELDPCLDVKSFVLDSGRIGFSSGAKSWNRYDKDLGGAYHYENWRLLIAFWWIVPSIAWLGAGGGGEPARGVWKVHVKTCFKGCRVILTSGVIMGWTLERDMIIHYLVMFIYPEATPLCVE